MRVGTKSILFGAHALWLHPWFVAAAWTKLYGFPWDPRLWVAFFVHDLGYWGKPNMDGPEGELHPTFGAEIMHALFDLPPNRSCHLCDGRIDFISGDSMGTYQGKCGSCLYRTRRWYDFTLYHSRFMAKAHGARFSKLCVADKLALVLTPAWLYLPMVNLTGEIKEYMKLADTRHAAGEPRFEGKYERMAVWNEDQSQWFANVQEYLRRWVEEHKDERQDTWTPGGL
jgi:hypothetical protein